VETQRKEVEMTNLIVRKCCDSCGKVIAEKVVEPEQFQRLRDELLAAIDRWGPDVGVVSKNTLSRFMGDCKECKEADDEFFANWPILY
jgi:hypothetical protein